ncbi:MAG: hypothetical protein JWQ96_1762 [Segetibacter sp.]|nr:hypothetical protein [Segetibacter sp.]
MDKQFLIKKICDLEERPAYSYKVETYFEDFVYENLLKPFDIIIDTSWTILLPIMIFKKEENSTEGISIYEPSTVEEEGVTYFPVSINIEDIYANGTVMENIVSLYYQVISLFFLNNYKSVSNEYMLELKNKIDWHYLLSLPYPVPYEQQKYVGDKTSK